ncbi:hypothetical protein PR202_gb09889 [Eleusine coracana subsp. coracana]|uniref:Uncharacterized protein n=1 Tax=Eleusine coracana subsp. coracana TaxID=191504 RepID=A0AAV5EG33_ELECO|nr:hypothetical protein PR202_gb09889 [Eleusine coracana subsp. coracana]
MASSLVLVVVATVLLSLAHLSAGSSRKLMELYIPPASEQLTYHQGSVLSGDIPVSILWYGKFTPSQKSIISDFLTSLTGAPTTPTPSQVSDEACSLGKSLTLTQIEQLAAPLGKKKGGIAVVLTDEDVAVEGFCRSRCGKHGPTPSGESTYIWVGNAATQCPGHCA